MAAYRRAIAQRLSQHDDRAGNIANSSKVDMVDLDMI